MTALTQVLLNLIAENDLRQQMGNATRVCALELFPRERITCEMVMLFDRLS